MKLARRAKLFAFASLFLMSLLFFLSHQPYVPVSSQKGIAARNQAAASKLLRSYAYRQTSGHHGASSSTVDTPTTAQFPSDRQMLDWQEYTDPVLQHFLRTITDGEASMIKGIYAPGKFALQVVQQPKGDWAFVSADEGVVTQFQSASGPVTGLLAHNYLEGKRFYELTVGEELELLFGNGFTRRYQVSNIYRYQKLDANSLSGDMIDINTGKRVTTGDVFQKLYTGSERVTLQTCLEGDGVTNWGLYFVIAQPVTYAQ